MKLQLFKLYPVIAEREDIKGTFYAIKGYNPLSVLPNPHGYIKCTYKDTGKPAPILIDSKTLDRKSEHRF